MARLRPPSAAICIATLALVVALGGTTYAAVVLPANSVGTAQLKDRAVTGAKVKDGSLTSTDINLSSLRTVPSAAHAASADTATHATSADTATHATSADTATHALTADAAGTAYSTHFEAGIALPTTPTVVASLNVGPGSYVLSSKGQVDTFTNGDIVECDIVAGTGTDKSFVQAGAAHQSQILVNSLVYTSPVAGTVSLRCQTFGGGSLSQVRLTAIPVGSVVNTP